MRLIQYTDSEGDRTVAISDEPERLNVIRGARSVYDLARDAASLGTTLPELARKNAAETRDSLTVVLREKRILPPLDHPNEPSRFWLTGTGLTHLGSATARDVMHDAIRETTTEPETDSMRIFRMGLEGGRPRTGEVGVQPEWFYKGTGAIAVAPEAPLRAPAFARSMNEEAEIVVFHLIDEQGVPRRLGYAIANEFSDHVMEAENYLYLAHSKLRDCSFGPELLVDDLPEQVDGSIRVIRTGVPHWTGVFESGPERMSHSVENLEKHHFKYDLFRQPGDIHGHFLGAALLSSSEGVSLRDGDEVVIDVPVFGAPLRNSIRHRDDPPIAVARLY